MNVGHGRKELGEAARTQMGTLAFSSAYAGGTNERAIELAEKLSALMYPSINTFFFTSGGAEASETSFKTARFYWKAVGKPDKFKVISRMRAYHGVTLAAMSATGLPAFWPMFEPRTPGFSHIDAPDPYRFVHTDTSVSLGVAAANKLEEAILREGPDTVAAFIAEPVQGAGGVIVPPDDYFDAHPGDLHQVRRAADRRRSDHRLRPHGTMVRARAVRRRARHHPVCEGHHQRLHPARRHRRVRHGCARRSTACRRRKRWMHAFTYSGHPTCCAVALKNIEILEREGLVDRAATSGARMLEKLRTLESLDGVGNVRGLGMMAAVEVVADKATKQLFPAEIGMAQKLTDALLDRGLYTRVAMDCICVAPPLVTTDAQIDRIVSIIGETVTAVVSEALSLKR